VHAFDRCIKYLPIVKREARYIGGLHAPYHYFLAQIKTESSCREGLIAYDGGVGLTQIMPETARELHQKYPYLRKIPYNPLSPEWNIRAGILYDYACYKATICEGWYFAFRAYNGGIANINREIKRAGSCEWKEVEKACRRGKDRYVDFCSVNISYPYKIFKFAEEYNLK
jgi:soluble lytic murein transglycosylase-like protein